MSNWMEITASQPEKERVVMTKIDDARGERNITELKRSGQHGTLWFYPDGSMYVYYTPTHWKPL